MYVIIGFFHLIFISSRYKRMFSFWFVIWISAPGSYLPRRCKLHQHQRVILLRLSSWVLRRWSYLWRWNAFWHFIVLFYLTFFVWQPSYVNVCHIYVPIDFQISMNALLVTYLMNTNTSLTIAMLMQTAQTPKVHFIARARLDSLEMESRVLVSDYECSTGRLEDVFKKY